MKSRNDAMILWMLGSAVVLGLVIFAPWLFGENPRPLGWGLVGAIVLFYALWLPLILVAKRVLHI